MTSEDRITTCDQCGHLEWATRLNRGECRICALFSTYAARTISV